MKKLFNVAKNLTKIVYRQNKEYVWTDLLSSIFDVIIPLLTIYISSKIVDSIIIADSLNVKNTIIIGLLVTSIVMLSNNFIRQVRDYFFDLMNTKADKNYINSFYSKDYSKIEDHKHIEDFAQIRAMERYMGINSESSFTFLLNFINALIMSLLSFAMFIKVFTPNIPATSKFKFLDNSIISILFITMLMISSLIASKSTSKILSVFFEKANEGTFANSLNGFYRFKIFDEKRSLDLRLYKQAELGNKYLKEINGPFELGGSLDNFFRTKSMGINMISALIDRTKFFLILAFVIIKTFEGGISPGEFTKYLGAILQFTTSLALAIDSFMVFKSREGNVKKILDFVQDDDTIYKGSLTTEKRNDRKYEVEFKNVYFKYNDDQDWILKDVNLKFDLGKRLAIVGENASGKSTFIKLLIRFYDPQKGQILLNGIDIKKYRYDDYLKIFSVVFQDFKLFAYPLAENIAGSKFYSEDKILEVLKDVGLDDRLVTMKDGLDTHLYRDIDKDGVMISGGEAQKIAIARALYQDSPYIILDEPTAALDPVAEQEIYQKLSDIIKDRTAIFISHRLSSCKFADEIVVFDKGSIIEKGSHKNLLKTKGKYSELWNAQAEYYV